MSSTIPDLSWIEAQRALLPLMRVDNRTNVRYIAREYFGLALVLWVSARAHSAWVGGSLTTWAFLPLAGLGVLLVAVFQHRLSGLAHDAAHGTLFRDRLANDLVSDLLLMFPLVAWTQTYRVAHLGHHQFVNDPERDPDLVRLNHPRRPHHFPISKPAFWRRYVLVALWPPSILRYLIGRARSANRLDAAPGRLLRAPYRFRVARCLRGTYWLALLATVHAAGAWPVFFLFWLLPLLTLYPLLMQLREIPHHGNAPDAGDLTNSRVFHVHPILSAAVFPYGQAFHLTHHLFAMVPHHRVALAHAVLSRHKPYRDRVVVCRGYFFRTPGASEPSILDVLARPLPHAVGRPHLRLGRGGPRSGTTLASLIRRFRPHDAARSSQPGETHAR